MNNIPQQQQNMNSWHAMYSVSDRQKIVQILSNTLKEIQNTNYDAQKATTMAQEFEKLTFMKSQSREEYLRLIKQKINQLRAGIRGNPTNNPGITGQVMGVGGMPQQQNNMNPQNMNFLQQQTQAMQQSAAQIQAQMRNNGIPNQGQPQPLQAQQQNLQPNHQQIQQISNMIRNVPIPQALLSKIPNLPPNVNTWTQIFDCFQKKVIPATVMPLAKDIHNTHLQLAIRQHQQQKLNQMQNQRMNQNHNANANPQSQPQKSNVGDIPASNNVNGSNNNAPVMNNVANFNMNNLNTQQKQQLLQRQMQQRNGMVSQNSQPLLQQNQQPQQPQQNQQQLKPPNFQITPQDIMKYSADAMALLARLQANGSIQSNLDPAQKDSFIRKYISYQKTQLWKQQNGQTPNNAVGIGSNNNNNTAINQAQVQRRLQQAPAQMQPQPQQQAQQAQNQSLQLSPMLNNMQISNQQPLMKQQTLSSPLMPQRGPNNIPMNNNNINIPTQQGRGANVQPSVTSILPPLTDEMKMKLRQLIEEVSRNNVALKDVTMLLSPQDKNAVRETMVKISQQYANVDSIISYFFIITRNIEGTKRLIQMKYMTKNIMDNLQRGVYLAAPNLLERLYSQYQKYFDYVKEQFATRRLQIQNQQQQQPNQQSQFMNNPRNGPIQSQVPPAQQRVPPQQAQQAPQQPMNIGPTNSWPNVGPPNQQQRANINSSPMIPNASPIMPNGIQIQAPVQQKQASKASTPQNKKASTNVATAGRRKTSNAKSVSSVSGMPTPAGNVTTPASLANAIKTPNSIPTPSVPQSQSNKNTPTGQSPNYPGKNLSANPSSSTQDVADIFSNSGADTKSAKRRELSNTYPEKFFYASLANLLELDESAVDNKSLPTPVQSSSASSTSNGVAVVKSPLSPVTNEWTCEIRPGAIKSAFEQVDSIKELVANDIIESCTKLAIEETKTVTPEQAIKRENDEMEDSDDIDNLFNEKKIKMEDNDFQYMYEPVEFDAWKEFVVSSVQ